MTPQLSLKDTLANADFQGLPIEERRKVLTARFPDFTLLPPLEQNKVLNYKEPFGQRLAERYRSGLTETIRKGVQLATGAGRGLATMERGLSALGTLGGSELFMSPQERAVRDKIETARTPLEKAGKTGVEVAGYFAPIPGLQELEAARGAGRLARAGVSALRSGVDVGMKSLMTGASPQEAATTAMLGGGAGAVVETGAPYISNLLTRMAKSQYAKVLHPLGRKAKEVAAEHLEDIVQSGYGAAAAPSKEALAAKFNERAAQLGRQISDKYQQLDATTRTRLGPIYKDFNDWVSKESFTPGGAIKDPAILNAAFEKLDYLQDTLGPYFKNAKPSEVWQIRDTLDKYVFKNGLTADESLEAAKQVRSGLSNSLRTQLNEQHPDLAALNNTFHLWRSAAELMNRNVTNEIGKQGFLRNTGIIGRFLMGAAVGGGGDVAGRQGEINPWETGAAAALAGLAFTSTGWRSVSAVTKAEIARLLMKGEGRAAARLAGRAVGVTRSRAFDQ